MILIDIFFELTFVVNFKSNPFPLFNSENI